MLDELEERASYFLLRQEDGDWTAEDQAQLDNWLQQSMRHKAVYWRLSHGWQQADRVASLDLPPASARAAFPFMRVFSAIRTLPGAHIWPKIAAGIVALMLPAALLLLAMPEWSSSPEYADYATGTGQRKFVTFPDGTQLDLNTNSAIRVKYTARERTIYLERGEAFFDVAHDATRPFYVHADDRLVQVLGTRFAVRMDEGKTVTSVVDGRVKLGRMVDGAWREALVLTRGDTAISQGGQTLAVYDDMDGVNNALGWMRGLLIFDRVTLGDAVQQFNRYNKRKLAIADDRLTQIQIGGAFRPENVEGFLRLMVDAHGLKIDETPDEVRLSAP